MPDSLNKHIRVFVVSVCPMYTIVSTQSFLIVWIYAIPCPPQQKNKGRSQFLFRKYIAVTWSDTPHSRPCWNEGANVWLMLLIHKSQQTHGCSCCSYLHLHACAAWQEMMSSQLLPTMLHVICWRLPTHSLILFVHMNSKYACITVDVMSVVPLLFSGKYYI